MIGEITYQPYDDGYAILLHEIIEQMLSIKVGANNYGRFQCLCGGSITADKISKLSDEDCNRTNGCIKQKILVR